MKWSKLIIWMKVWALCMELYCDQFVLAIILMWVIYELWLKSCINSVCLNTKNSLFVFSVYVCVRMHVHVYMCVHVYVWLCVYVCACLCVCTHACLFSSGYISAWQVWEWKKEIFWTCDFMQPRPHTYILGNYDNTKGTNTHSLEI